MNKRHALSAIALGSALALAACNSPENNPSPSAPSSAATPAAPPPAVTPMDQDNMGTASTAGDMGTNGMGAPTGGMNAQADADYKAAQQRCDSMSGDSRTTCLQQAQQAYEAQKNTAPPPPQTGGDGSGG